MEQIYNQMCVQEFKHASDGSIRHLKLDYGAIKCNNYVTMLPNCYSFDLLLT